MKTGTLTWNGENSLTDHGVYVSGPGAHNAAEADVTAYQIPGRNGDLVISNNRFKNIEVRYPAFIAHGFAGKEQDVRNWLRSSVGYRRLEDTYDQTHFRMGRPTGELEFSPARPDGANFEIAFDCKPQRFLKSGETEEEVNPLIGEETQSAYSFRAISPQDGRNAEFQTLVGGTVAWNQMIHGDFGSDYATYWRVYSGTGSVSNGVLTVTGAVGRDGVRLQNGEKPAGKLLDKWFVSLDYKNTVDFNMHAITLSVSLPVSSDWVNLAYIGRLSSETQINQATGFDIFPRVTGVTGDISMRNFMAINLTAMFGSTIADYIYTLEQSTAGAGVSWFKKLFPKPYYAYNPGELLSVNAVGKKTVGFNQWDEEWELGNIDSDTGNNTSSSSRFRSQNHIPVLPNTTYYFYNGSNATYALRFYDASKAYIGAAAGQTASMTFTTPANCYYMRFVSVQTTYANDICINLSWDGERDGEYEPYEAHVYPLDDLTLRGIPKLDASNNLYYDGDTYEADGTVTRRYRVITIDGTESWAGTASSGWYFQEDRLKKRSVYKGFMLADKLVAGENLENSLYGYIDYNNSYPGENWICYKNTGLANKNEVKALFAANPVTLVYELATPTTEQADPYTQPFVVDDFGTEAFIDGEHEAGDRDVEIPVGNVTRYQKRGLTITNPTPFDARPLLRVVNPASGDVININGQTITFAAGHTGELYIDCELMDAYANGTNANSKITLSDFPVLKPGDNIVTWSGSGELYIAPRWWEL